MLRILFALLVAIAAGAPAAAAGKRAALVMAADRYELLRPLDNAVNDARAIDAMIAAKPENPGWQSDSAIVRRKVAEAMQQRGDKEGALTIFQSALAISERLAAKEPGNRRWQAELATGHNRVADVQFALGRKAEALAGYRKSLEIMQALAAGGPSDPTGLWNLSLAYRQVAAMGDAPAENLSKALSILEALEKQGLLDQANAAAPQAARKELAEAKAAIK